jgi:adenosine deaminase CECR1
MRRNVLVLILVASWYPTPGVAQVQPPAEGVANPFRVLREMAIRRNPIRSQAVISTPEEQKARAALRAVVAEEIATYKRSRQFPASKPFFLGKEAIELTKSFAILRAMPKGGALHIHSTTAGRARWIVFNACYRPNCYVFWPDLGGVPEGEFIKGELRFFKPGFQPRGFLPIAEVRKSVAGFDRQLLSLITFGPEDDPSPDIWGEFSKCFRRIINVISYQPVFVEYFVDAFETLVDDGVDYIELRTGLGSLFDLDGHTWEGDRFIEQYAAVRDRVRARFPDFDLKLIITGSRSDSVKDVRMEIWKTFPLRKKRPDFVLGYDLVGEEDAGSPMSLYFSLLVEVSLFPVYYGINMPLYLHEGETLWHDESNLRGAYLLGARRIGHGLNLFGFPELERHFILRRVPLEVCPVSNQALRYVGDLRLHPANQYLRGGVTCVISSDDPAVFGNDGLSYDFWEALLAWDLDLADLKRLALNSIEFSAMSAAEKDGAKARWQKKWDQFVRDLAGRAVRSP